MYVTDLYVYVCCMYKRLLYAYVVFVCLFFARFIIHSFIVLTLTIYRYRCFGFLVTFWLLLSQHTLVIFNDFCSALFLSFLLSFSVFVVVIFCFFRAFNLLFAVSVVFHLFIIATVSHYFYYCHCSSCYRRCHFYHIIKGKKNYFATFFFCSCSTWHSIYISTILIMKITRHRAHNIHVY